MMDIFDQSLQIQAPIDLVWKEARKFAKKGRIKIEEKPELLVSQGSLKIGYVYLLQELQDKTTQFRHVIAPISAIFDAVESGQPISEALDSVSQHPDSLSEKVAGGFMTMLEFPSFVELGDDQLTKIQRRAEKKAR